MGYPTNKPPVTQPAGKTFASTEALSNSMNTGVLSKIHGNN